MEVVIEDFRDVEVDKDKVLKSFVLERLGTKNEFVKIKK